MEKKRFIILSIAGIFILGLCVKFAVNSKDVPVIENAAAEESSVLGELNERVGHETTEPESSGEVQPEDGGAERDTGSAGTGGWK